MAQAKKISVAKLLNLINAKANVRVIDVRSPAEYKEKHIPVAEHFPVDKIETGEFTAKQGEIIVATCGSGGGRSERSAKLITERFNVEAYCLDGGTFGWFREMESRQVAKDSLWQKFIKAGHLPSDSESDKLKKSSLLIASSPFTFVGLVWGVLYFYNGLWVQGWIPFMYGVVSLLTTVHFVIWKNFKLFRFSQIFLILLLPFLLQLSLGGFIPSSAVILWSLISPLGALVFYDIKKSIFWLGGYVILLIASFFFKWFIYAVYFQQHFRNIY